MRARGVLYMAISAFSFSIMSMLVKVASARLPASELMLARGVVTLVLSYAMLANAGVPAFGNDRRRLVLRGALGSIALAGYYVALVRLPLADATTLQQTTPLITSLLAWWLLGEHVGWSTALAIALGIAGVLLVVHPSGNGLDRVGVGVGLGGAVCSALAYVTVRKLASTDHPLVIVFYFQLITVPLALPWALAGWVTPTPLELLLLAAMGVATHRPGVLDHGPRGRARQPGDRGRLPADRVCDGLAARRVRAARDAADHRRRGTDRRRHAHGR